MRCTERSTCVVCQQKTSAYTAQSVSTGLEATSEEMWQVDGPVGPNLNQTANNTQQQQTTSTATASKGTSDGKFTVYEADLGYPQAKQACIDKGFDIGSIHSASDDSNIRNAGNDINCS